MGFVQPTISSLGITGALGTGNSRRGNRWTLSPNALSRTSRRVSTADESVFFPSPARMARRWHRSRSEYGASVADSESCLDPTSRSFRKSLKRPASQGRQRAASPPSRFVSLRARRRGGQRRSDAGLSRPARADGASRITKKRPRRHTGCLAMSMARSIIRSGFGSPTLPWRSTRQGGRRACNLRWRHGALF